MTHLRKIMLEELQRRNYSDSTIRHYLHWVEEFARHFDTSPDKLGLDDFYALIRPICWQRNWPWKRRQPCCCIAILVRAHVEAP